MLIIGLTGSLAMGKSTAAAMLARLGVPVHDADRAVHRLMARGGAAVAPVGAAFPDAVRDGVVDRRALGRLVFGDAAALARLEAIVHPLVRAATKRFLADAARAGHRLVVLDIPLLYEGGRERIVDVVVCVSAPPAVQRARALARPGMDAARFRAILAHQLPDAAKRARADFVVPTGLGRAVTWQALSTILRRLRGRRGRHWPPTRLVPPPLVRPVHGRFAKR